MTVMAGGRWPWHRRIGRNVESLHVTAHKNTPIELWPREPESPTDVDRNRFRDAVGTLCGTMPASRLDAYARAILDRATQFDIDPFLLASLMYDQSRCWPRTPKRDAAFGRFGLTRIPVEMHAPQIRHSEYSYYVRENNAWQKRVLKLDQYRFNEWKVRKPEQNLYFAAAFLRVFSNQADSLDQSFSGVPHRHPISHWFYGDRVQGAEPENRVLTARRRLLTYYLDKTLTSAGTFNGTPIVSPLDGVPRLVIDYFSNPRNRKTGYTHRGIDIDGTKGEPVRAIAAGRVAFSGTDLPGPLQNKILSPEQAALLTNKEMGPGGLYVSINHGNGFGTIYMHLESLAVKYLDEVKAGQIIGTMGRSGTQTSGPHLHLEFRQGTNRTDPAIPLSDILVNPFSS